MDKVQFYTPMELNMNEGELKNDFSEGYGVLKLNNG